MTEITDEDIANLVIALAELAKILAKIESEPLKMFAADLTRIDDVEDRILDPFRAEARRKLRRLTIQQAETILQLKKIVADIRETQNDFAAATMRRRQTEEELKRGDL